MFCKHLSSFSFLIYLSFFFLVMASALSENTMPPIAGDANYSELKFSKHLDISVTEILDNSIVRLFDKDFFIGRTSEKEKTHVPHKEFMENYPGAVVLFYMDQCRISKAMASVLKELEKEYGNHVFFGRYEVTSGYEAYYIQQKIFRDMFWDPKKKMELPSLIMYKKTKKSVIRYDMRKGGFTKFKDWLPNYRIMNYWIYSNLINVEKGIKTDGKYQRLLFNGFFEPKLEPINSNE